MIGVESIISRLWFVSSRAVDLPPELTATEIANYVSKECLLSGLLVCNTGRESIKLGPPLTIDKKGIKKAIQILDKAITKGYLL